MGTSGTEGDHRLVLGETQTANATPRFDLLEQPWIMALDETGRLRTESLRSVFHHAGALSTLTGEVPTQAFAVFRLLLAVLRRSVGHRTGRSVEIWRGLWSTSGWPSAELDAYLTAHAERFDLLDAAQPFMQVADLQAVSGDVSSLDRLIADVPNGEKYFTTRAGCEIDAIGFAEAARWLVHAHAFDPSGIKTGAVGDPRVKNGKGYPIGVAWTGNLGGVLLEGRNLRETLLLNLVLVDIDGERFDPDDRPAWEREPCRPHVEGHRVPSGPADLCTWQSRRIRLVHSDTHVTGVILCNGDPLEPRNRYRIEPMCGWRFSPNQSKKAGGKAQFLPRTHDPQRALWRGMSALLGEIGTRPGDSETIAPGVLEWMYRLLDADALDPAHQVRLHAIGMEYINNQSVVGDIYDDAIGFRIALLSSNPALRQTALNAVQTADDLVAAVAILAGNLAIAAGGDADGARARARGRGYFALDAPYRRWLGDLSPGCDTAAATEQWEHTTRQIIESLGRDLIDAAGTPAWIGRVVGDHYIDASVAAIWFRARLRKLLPAAYPTHLDHGDTAA
ncbi:type I-E CRISPR-associated protein Cse1/CasA [Nocardia sp. CC227C]|uniref:type I-E CRISPR-associated protein Cse1/CasA n=1 Tax=Nocardia sp. CC227C TaxID=3044562 RepID=UPI00278C33D2|nr:type I-E CRISPR-associated protein Cse1/CasA [Nocardia sp. CC227C]